MVLTSEPQKAEIEMPEAREILTAAKPDEDHDSKELCNESTRFYGLNALVLGAI
jgi:hypothetical protein